MSEIHEYSFEKLSLWTDIRALNKMIYSTTADYPDSEKYGLVNQMRRASISVGSNLAEGSSRTGAKDQAHFYQIAYSSLLELLSQVIVSKDIEIIGSEKYFEIRELIQKVTYKLNSLRKSALNRKPN